jgi:antitoxin VapB
MNKPDPDQVRDARQTFDLAGAGPQASSLAAAGKVLRAKVFKSGNSLALRLPKALGLEAGMEMEIEIAPLGGQMNLRKAEPAKKKLDVSAFWGKAKGLKVPERFDFDDRPSTIATREAAKRAADQK